MSQSNQNSARQRELTELLNTAMHWYRQGNLPQTELLSRHVLHLYGDHPAANMLLGMIALAIGLPEFAISYLERACCADPSSTVARENLILARNRQAESRNKAAESGTPVAGTPREDSDRFLLIKAWGCGFWADMDNVLGQLLLAEVTDRVPVVHWGNNSLFRENDSDNAWDLYFEPVSPYGIDDLPEKISTLYPPKWTKNKLRVNENNKWSGPYSRVAGIHLLNRDEDLVVNDFHTYVKDLVPWIRENHPLHGMKPQELYRVIFRKYIRLKADIEEEINSFLENRIRGQNVLAVHVRGSDKLNESTELWEINNAYHGKIDEYLDTRPGSRIFLLTDSQDILAEYRNKYKEKLIYADCRRTGDDRGVHMQEYSNRRSLGVDVIKDVFIAAGCNHFLGCGHSNVSTAIFHLKNWSEGEYTLLGENRLYHPNFFLHRR